MTHRDEAEALAREMWERLKKSFVLHASEEAILTLLSTYLRQARRELVWIKDGPTSTGHYWYRFVSWGAKRVKIVDVERDKNGLYVSAYGYLDLMEGEWSSHPLDPPQERTP